jgi:hypothetical protein
VASARSALKRSARPWIALSPPRILAVVAATTPNGHTSLTEAEMGAKDCDLPNECGCVMSGSAQGLLRVYSMSCAVPWDSLFVLLYGVCCVGWEADPGLRSVSSSDLSHNQTIKLRMAVC